MNLVGGDGESVRLGELPIKEWKTDEKFISISCQLVQRISYLSCMNDLVTSYLKAI
jgi:hypothetical protein